MVGLGHRELLPCLVALLLPPFGTVEDGGDRQHGDNDLVGVRGGEREGEEGRVRVSAEGERSGKMEREGEGEGEGERKGERGEGGRGGESKGKWGGDVGSESARKTEGGKERSLSMLSITCFSRGDD